VKPKPKVIVVLPAYQAEKTLELTVRDIPLSVVDEILLVDDRSNDHTVEIARKFNLVVEQHTKNLGYGANQKTCYLLTLRRNFDKFQPFIASGWD
jgi:glycosyltransferase involved in cell wall biosynthesis